MLSMIPRAISQAYPPKPALTEENIRDLHDKVRLLPSPKPIGSH